MIDETLRQIESRIQDSRSIKDENREDLLQLIATLRAEIKALPAKDREQAQSITTFAHVSAHEATREGKNPQLLDLSLQGLSASVEGFETSHPKLVQLVNRICTTLSNLGV